MNGYNITLGTYDDVHGKIDYKIYAPQNLQQYMKTFNSSLFSQVPNEEQKIFDVVTKTNDPSTRLTYRYDANFPFKSLESAGIPESMIDMGAGISDTAPCLEGFKAPSKMNGGGCATCSQNPKQMKLQQVPSVNVKAPEKYTKCSVDGTCGSSSSKINPNLLSPAFNLREVAKQSLLLEDHLFHPDRRCKDCINKHCLIIEGFLEEAKTLDNNLEYVDTIQELMKEFRTLSQDIYDVVDNDINTRNSRWIEIAQKLRKFRKPICQKYAKNL